jgi:hypothetical protein
VYDKIIVSIGYIFKTGLCKKAIGSKAWASQKMLDFAFYF